MKKAFLVSYRRFHNSTEPMCTNIVYAENEQAIAESKYGRYAWYSVSEPGQAHDLDAYKRRGMPVVEV